MRDKQTMHLKVQELCDCYATTDPLREMSALEKDDDKDEAALKWIALAVLHGINANAEKVSIARSNEGTVTVSAKYRKGPLPTPGPEIGGKIIEAIRAITHLESDEGKIPLALGIRDGSIELSIKMKRSKDGEKISIKFPE